MRTITLLSLLCSTRNMVASEVYIQLPNSRFFLRIEKKTIAALKQISGNNDKKGISNTAKEKPLEAKTEELIAGGGKSDT